jgi:hypothetical protein
MAPRAELERATLRFNRRKTPVLPQVAAARAEVPDPELTPMKSDPIDERGGAAHCRPKPRLGGSKGQEKGKAKSG